MKNIRVLIVDDSAFMRKAIRQMLETDSAIEVIGAARDGQEGLDMCIELKPDVVTMDIEMPRMNGIQATEEIMSKSPCPILMLSSLTTDGAKATLDALDKGAVDYIPKNLARSALDVIKVQEELITKIKAVSSKGHALSAMGSPQVARVYTPPPVVAERSKMPQRSIHATQKVAVIVIGASTGGPKAIQHILPSIPVEINIPILVVVHMPEAFTGPFATRMDSICDYNVREAKNNDRLEAGTVLVAPGGLQTRLKRLGSIDVAVEVSDGPADQVYKPSVDITMDSVGKVFPGRSLGVILTGMGQDGLNGIKVIKSSGGKVMAQDEATSVVYGMPKAVVDAGLADKIVPLESIAGEIVNMV